MKFLITGAKGFIGSHLKTALLNPDNEIYCFEEQDALSPRYKQKLLRVVKKVDLIYHIGAVSSTDASDINKTMFLNYEFSKTLFDLAAEYKVPIVYASSAAIYGDGDNIPKNLYAWTKKAAEDYGLLKVQQFISLRFHNVFGEDEASGMRKGKMASVAFQAWNDKKVYEQNFRLFKGRPTRDFVYIKDVVGACEYVSYQIGLKQTPQSGAYDVGTGESRPFEDVLDLMNVEYCYTNSEVPPWYQFHTQADKKKFLTFWKPHYTLEEGIQDYLECLKNEK